jgi:hypothetical protein
MGSVGRQKNLEWLLYRFEKAAAGGTRFVGLAGALVVNVAVTVIPCEFNTLKRGI